MNSLWFSVQPGVSHTLPSSSRRVIGLPAMSGSLRDRLQRWAWFQLPHLLLHSCQPQSGLVPGPSQPVLPAPVPPVTADVCNSDENTARPDTHAHLVTRNNSSTKRNQHPGQVQQPSDQPLVLREPQLPDQAANLHCQPQSLNF